jgi:transcription elongation GreA/GreB family factor
MSRAFVREQEDDAVQEELPERQISEHPNFVTPEGLAAIEAEIARLQAEFDAAGEDKGQIARIQRDLRYWRARRMTAQVVPPTQEADEVRFGSKVTIEREDGRRQTWRIVGEDEAEPSQGTLSYVAPLARALVGKRPGDEVEVPGGTAEIVEIVLG